MPGTGRITVVCRDVERIGLEKNERGRGLKWMLHLDYWSEAESRFMGQERIGNIAYLTMMNRRVCRPLFCWGDPGPHLRMTCTFNLRILFCPKGPFWSWWMMFARHTTRERGQLFVFSALMVSVMGQTFDSRGAKPRTLAVGKKPII